MPRGSLTIVVGSVGAGKSSLLAALLGEMATLQGSVVVRGSTAFTQQDSWIQVGWCRVYRRQLEQVGLGLHTLSLLCGQLVRGGWRHVVAHHGSM